MWEGSRRYQGSLQATEVGTSSQGSLCKGGTVGGIEDSEVQELYEDYQYLLKKITHEDRQHNKVERTSDNKQVSLAVYIRARCRGMMVT